MFSQVATWMYTALRKSESSWPPISSPHAGGPPLLGYTSVFPAEDNLMPRLSMSLVAVAALAAGAAAQPRPVWSKDLAGKDKTWNPVVDLGFTPDGRTLNAVVAWPRIPSLATLGASRLWGFDVAERKELFHLDPGGHPGHQVAPLLAYALDGRLVTAYGKAITVRNARDGKVFAQRGVPDQGPKRASGWWTGVWTTSDGKGVYLHDNGEEGYRLFRGPLPARGDAPSEWKEVRPSPRPPQQGEPTEFLSDADVSRDGARLAVTVYDNVKRRETLTLFALGGDAGVELRTLARADVTSDFVFRNRFSPDGRTLATDSSEGRLRLWGTVDAARAWDPRATVETRARSSRVTFRPDGRVLALGQEEKVWLVDVQDGKARCSFPVPDQVTAIVFSPDGKLLATGNVWGRLHVWDVEQVMGGQKK